MPIASRLAPDPLGASRARGEVAVSEIATACVVEGIAPAASAQDPGGVRAHLHPRWRARVRVAR